MFQGFLFHVILVDEQCFLNRREVNLSRSEADAIGHKDLSGKKNSHLFLLLIQVNSHGLKNEPANNSELPHDEVLSQ